VLAGSRLRFAQVLALVLGALALSATLLAAAVPVTAFFLLTGANYYFLTLLHIVIVLGAGLAGMVALHDGLAFACEQRGVYPRKAMAIMKAWAVLFAFVGIQMAWNLQPFVGDRGAPFRLFRHHEGNFYTAIGYAIDRLARGEGRPAQAAAAAIKLPALFLGTLAICFPAFFVVQVLAGSRLRLVQVLALVLGALSLSATLLAAAVPITVFFLLTGANYYFLTLLHIVIVLGAGLVGMIALHEGLAFACERRDVYPRKAMAIMKAWAVLFAFVGIQMAWNLQPFVGDRGTPFQLFRHHEGNFYTAIGYALDKLARGEGRPSEEPPARDVQEVRRRIDAARPNAADTSGAGRP